MRPALQTIITIAAGVASFVSIASSTTARAATGAVNAATPGNAAIATKATRHAASRKAPDDAKLRNFRKAGSQEDLSPNGYEVTAADLQIERQNPAAVTIASDGNTIADFGKVFFGKLSIRLTAENDRDTVVIHVAEAGKDGRADRNPGGTIRYQRHLLPLEKGTHTYQIPFPADKRNTGPAAIKMPKEIGIVLPFRYVEVENYPHPLSAESFVREAVTAHYNPDASYFRCSNDTLNAVWELCRHSIIATSFTGIYIDGDRERIPYEADALINQLCHYGIDASYKMARRSIEYLLDHPTWPTEWILQVPILAWNDYMYTGDSGLIAKHYDLLKIHALEALREQNGLISTKTGLLTPEVMASYNFKSGTTRDIVDWPNTTGPYNPEKPDESDGYVFTEYNCVVNAFHYKALRCLASMAEVLGNEQDRVYYTSLADSFLKLFNDSFLVDGLYRDGIGTDHASLHANMFPLAFGMAPEEYAEGVYSHIKSRGMACSVYGSHFLLEALYGTGHEDYALELLTSNSVRSWYNMIRCGSTISMEAWDNRYKPNQDWNHAWGAAPAGIIPRFLVGVQPLTPGGETISVRPQIGNLDFVEARVPLAKGSVFVNITRQGSLRKMKLTVPRGCKAVVTLEGKAPVTVGSGKHRFTY